MCAAIDFALSLQAPQGEIHWAISPQGHVDPMALLTGSSSIYMSIKCALALAGGPRAAAPRLAGRARHELGNAIRAKPHLFNMTKSRFSMDWFYPVLAGAVTGADAAATDRARLAKIRGGGPGGALRVGSALDCDCRNLRAGADAGRHGQPRSGPGRFRLDQRPALRGRLLLGRLHLPGHDRLARGPASTWTNAGVLIAADAIFGLTPAAGLFSHRFGVPPRSLNPSRTCRAAAPGR
ncbi:MAG: hypothetical protein MZV70_49555 [Desulfobacterales bacterium]|nr:hypothetical protein [Desulfobacterales bacterium]